MSEHAGGAAGHGAEIARLRQRVIDLERRSAPRAGDAPSEVILHDMLEALPVAIYELDAEGRIVFTNSAYARITGYGVEDLLGLHVAELQVPGPARDGAGELFRRLISETPPPTPILAENLHKDGHHLHVEVHWNYRRDSQGKAIGFVCALQDVTDRTEAVEGMRLSEERFRRVFEQAPWGTVVYAPSGRPLYVNSVQLASMGLSEDDLAMAMAHYNILQDKQLIDLGFMPIIERGFAGDRVVIPETLYDPRRMNPAMDQEPRWMRGYVYPIKDDRGTVEEVVVVFEDTTREKEAEAHRVALEARLQQAQKLESLSVLAGGIAHDFNNLLVAILGNADLALLDLPEDSPVRSSVHDIVGGASRAADLVKQLLAYSGRSQVKKGPVDVSALVEEVGHLVEAAISKKALLRRELDHDVPAVEADGTQLRQIVMNLIINAAESLGGHTGTVTVRTGAKQCDPAYLAESYIDDDLPGGTYCFIEVEDTGVGMDAGTQERLFEPFFTTKFTGRGLGLAAVLGIVRGHRGAIKVRSEPNAGASFEVLLPAAEARAVSQEAGPRASPWRGDGTVLVVDDEESVRFVAQRMLERIGFEVIVAADGEQALDRVREEPGRFVAVLLDLSMPRMDGVECMRELHSMQPDLPVLISSGFGESDLAGRFVDDSPAGFVQKPYKLAALSEHLRGVLT